VVVARARLALRNGYVRGIRSVRGIRVTRVGIASIGKVHIRRGVRCDVLADVGRCIHGRLRARVLRAVAAGIGPIRAATTDNACQDGGDREHQR
jgi:hypothetical protein